MEDGAYMLFMVFMNDKCFENCERTSEEIVIFLQNFVCLDSYLYFSFNN
jgi:hypothetical protein